MAILRRLNERFACFSGRLVDEAIEQDFAEPLRPLGGSLFVDLALDGDEFHGGSTGPIIDDEENSRQGQMRAAENSTRPERDTALHLTRFLLLFR